MVFLPINTDCIPAVDELNTTHFDAIIYGVISYLLLQKHYLNFLLQFSNQQLILKDEV